MPSIVDSFISFSTDVGNSFSADLAALNNDAGFVSPVGDSTAQFLENATLVPSNATIGTRSAQPAYVVLSRAAAKGGTGTAADVLSLVMNSQANLNVPHLFVSAAGGVFQFADLKNTVPFLNITSAPPSALTFDQVSDEVLDSIISFTVQNEGRDGYDSWSVDRGGGIAWGFIQFDQPKGSFPRLMKLMNDLDHDDFFSIFGIELAPILLDDTQVRKYPLATFRDYFTKASRIEAFQQAQRQLAKSLYWTGALDVARILGVYTQRAFAIYFDGAVQRGPAFMVSAAQIASEGNGDFDKLSKLATLADTSNASFSGLLPVSLNRRIQLLNSPFLKDVPLQQIDPASTAGNVSDDNAVICMLEGPVDGPVTQDQLNALTLTTRALCDAYSIPISSNRIFGADRLPAYAAINPGQFNYVDFYASVKSLPAIKTLFKDPASIQEEKFADGLNAVAASLSFSGSGGFNLKTSKSIAGLDAYDVAKTTQRSGSVLQSRQQHYAAAALQTTEKVKINGAKSADVAATDASLADVQQVAPTAVKGLLFNFTTGLWSDGKPVGKIDA